MNPAANAAVSGGVAGAAVVILNYACSLIPHIGALPSDVQAAVAVLLTAGTGYYLHTRSLVTEKSSTTPPPAAGN